MPDVEDTGKGDAVTEHKSFQISEFKALNNQDEPGSFEALVAVFGNVDAGGDRIVKGAFARTLAEREAKGRSLPVLWSHDAETVPIGVVTEATEINAGLRVKAKLLVDDNSQAKAVHAAMKAGALHEFSFGYAAKEFAEKVEQGQKIRELKDVDLFEVSPVFRGMNPASQLRAVKSLPDDAQDELASITAELAESQKKLTALSEAQANVALKALADAIGEGLEALEQGEHEDNPDPNPTEVGEEEKARIGRLLLEKPIHQEATDEHEDEPAQGEAV